MKKRQRILTAALASVMAASCAFGVVACGDEPKTENAGNADNTFRSEKLADEAAWKAAFDYTQIQNVTVDYTFKISEERERTYKHYVDGNKERLVGKSVDKSDNYNNEYDMYNELVESQKRMYHYSLDAQQNKYAVSFTDVSDGEFTMIYAEHDIDELDDVVRIKEKYADYHYDEKSGAYIAEYPKGTFDDDYGGKVVVKFKDGKCVEGHIDATSSEHGKLVMDVIVSDVGTTKVTIPTNINETPND